MREFPEFFDTRELAGARGRAFQEPEDAFQQLVGAWVLELDPRATVTRTAAVDGSIDHCLSANRVASPLIQGATFPLIVECKRHDETSANHAKNVLNGWEAVERKLSAKEADGWPGLYRPWARAGSYLYCVSGRLSEDTRATLKESIRAFFAASSSTNVGWVEVVDWGNLRAEFGRHARLRDAWLGVGADGLIDHATFEAGLSGARSYLKDETLAYVPPAADASHHPDRLFADLGEKANRRGVLVVGPGGVGKTRLAVETARRATRAGWRVLHVDAGPDRRVSLDDVAGTVLPGIETAPVLLIVDYLEQCDGLNEAGDLDAFRRRILSVVAERGGRLAVLALARPGAAQAKHNEWGVFFDRVEIEPNDDHGAEVIRAMLAAAAPDALRRLGADVMSELVGSRPIIALFIAREIERRALEAGEGGYDAIVADARRNGTDLARWLETRLREDALVPEGTARRGLLARAPGPTPAMIAAAATLAAAPLEANELPGVGRAALEAAGEADVEGEGERLLAELERMGWLERRGDVVFAAHDVVTDEVVDRCLFDPSRSSPRSKELAAVLAPGLDDPRVLGRHAATFARAFGSADGDKRAGLERALGDWLDDLGEAFPRSLARWEPDRASYALGAALASPLAPALRERWGTVIGPWMSACERSFDARHVLRRAAIELPSGSFSTVRAAVWVWLTQHGRRPAATLILAPLLDRTDLDKGDARRAIIAALVWLEREGNDLSPEAQFVLHSLLDRTDLDKGDAHRAIAAAVVWLEREGNDLSPEARFVLRSLLDRTDLGDDAAAGALTAAFRWLAEGANGVSPEASFVLPPLLKRTDLGDDAAADALTAAFRWLTEGANGVSPEAQFVLRSLLDRTDLDKGDAHRAIAAAVVWLAKGENGVSLEASHVLQSLLKRTDLGDDAAAGALTAAFRWLAEGGNGVSPEASHVLPPLLDRRGLDGERASRAVDLAFSWLDRGDNATSPDASHVMRSLLRHHGLHGADRNARLVERMIDWVDRHRCDDDADFLLKRLLRRPADVVDDRRWMELADIAWDRIDRSGNDDPYLLEALLKRPRLLGGEVRSVLGRFLAVCEAARDWGLPEQVNRYLKNWLFVVANDPARGASAPVDGTATYFETRWRDDDVDGYVNFLAPLLPLAHRDGDAGLIARVEGLAERALRSPRLSDHGRDAFVTACRSLLVNGAWPDREVGRTILARLGVDGASRV